MLEVIDEVDMQLYGKRTVPRLCYHEGLSFNGNCRLCLVEVEKDDKTKIRTSCNYKISEGIIVSTYNPKIADRRKKSIESLLVKAPNSEVIKDMAFRMGLEKVYQGEQKGNSYLENCVSCSLCVRTCKEIVGKSAISMKGRGIDRHPSIDKNDDCIGCGLCSYICPTGAINMEEKDGKRIIWGKEFDILKIGKYKQTQEQIDYMKTIKKSKESAFKIEIKTDLCKNCEICVVECPQFLFSVDQKFNKKGFNPALWNDTGLQDNNLSCAGCKVCYDVCPESAIDIYTVKKNVRILEND